MKCFLALAALLTAIACFSQEPQRTDSSVVIQPLTYRTSYIYYNPNRPSGGYMEYLFENEARVLPELYAKKDFARMRVYLDSMKQKSAAFWSYWRYQTAPLFFCMQTLLDIQTRQFNPASISDTGFTATLAGYARVMRQMNRTGSSGYLLRRGLWTSYGLTDHFVTLARNWATDLLASGKLSENETFLCQTFAGQIKHPVNTILARKNTFGHFDTLVNKSFKFNRRTGFFLNFMVSAGVWSPSGSLGSLGNHASLGYNILGLRDRWNEYDLYFAHRFVNTAQPFSFTSKDTLYHGRIFYSGYYGLDYTRYLISTPHFETGIIAGLGDEELTLQSYGAGKSIDLNTLSLSAGLRMNYFFTKFTYIGASCKYSWLNYQNPGGTNLQGNGLSADVYFGVNILTANRGKK
jgi:hypothetical protein